MHPNLFRVFTLSIVLFMTLNSLALGGQDSDSSPDTLDLLLVNSSGQPIQGVEAHFCPPYGSVFSEEKPLGVSDERGRIQLRQRVDDPMGLSVFLIADGKRCDLVSAAQVGKIPTKIVMQDETQIPVLVTDEEGKPIRGAWVSPHTISFHESFWTNNLSQAAMRRLQVATDGEGRAMLRGTQGERLESIMVTRKDSGARLFQLPDRRAPNEPIVVTWTSFHGSIRCRVLDHAGNPVPDAPVIVSAPEESVNQLAIEQPALNYIEFGKTDAEGRCTFHDVSVPFVTVDSSYYDYRNLYANQTGVRIERNRATSVELRYRPVQKVIVSIVDTAEFEGHSGIEVLFSKKAPKGTYFVRNHTNEDGIAEVFLGQGKWDYQILGASLPRGYLQGALKKWNVTVEATGESIVTPPLMIEKGRIIEGVIRGVDLSTLRADWIIASIQNKFTGEADELQGRYDANGKFEVTIPNGTKDEAIESFEISHSPVTNRQKLTIVSRNPWLLEGAAQPNP